MGEVERRCGTCTHQDKLMGVIPCCYCEKYDKWEPVEPEYAQVYDPIGHPAHYTQHPSGVECIEIVEHMNFCLGNVVKYVWRHSMKGGIDDLKKAQTYLEREIKRLESQS